MEWGVWTGPRLPHLSTTATFPWADDRRARPRVRIDVGGWEVGGRLPRGPDADVRRVRSLSAATQTRRMFALEMDRPGHKIDQMGPDCRALGHLIYPFYPKRTGPDRMGSRGGVGLRLVTMGRNLGVTSHTPIQLCLCVTYLIKREVLVVTS